MLISFRTDRCGQTVQTQIRLLLEQIRLLLEEQSDLGLRCLPFCLHRLDALHSDSTSLYKFLEWLQLIFPVSENLGNLRLTDIRFF